MTCSILWFFPTGYFTLGYWVVEAATLDHLSMQSFQHLIDFSKWLLYRSFLSFLPSELV